MGRDLRERAEDAWKRCPQGHRRQIMAILKFCSHAELRKLHEWLIKPSPEISKAENNCRESWRGACESRETLAAFCSHSHEKEASLGQFF